MTGEGACARPTEVRKAIAGGCEGEGEPAGGCCLLIGVAEDLGTCVLCLTGTVAAGGALLKT